MTQIPNPPSEQITHFYLLLAFLMLGGTAYGIWHFVASEFIAATRLCIQSNFSELNPLIVGQTTRVSLGRGNELISECTITDRTPPGWYSDHPNIAAIAPDGTITGIAPGEFNILTPVNSTIKTSGVVYPPGWTARIEPEQATARVGDRVTFNMVAIDAQGNPLPPIFFQLATPHYRAPDGVEPLDSAPILTTPPFLDRQYHGYGTKPGTFKALRPGTLMITGKMAGQTRQATLTIKE